MLRTMADYFAGSQEVDEVPTSLSRWRAVIGDSVRKLTHHVPSLGRVAAASTQVR